MKNHLTQLTTLALTLTTTLTAQITVTDFDDIRLYTLQNQQNMTVKITNYGATITTITVPDRNGNLADIALGYNKLRHYTNAIDKPYFGAIVGRYANRIANAQFTLDGKTYKLAANNGPNHLHGGNTGFDKVIWTAHPTATDNWHGLQLHYHAKHLEENYPGNLHITVTYQLHKHKNQLTVQYHATTDQPTPINLTQHTYFNLKGEGNGNILNHQLTLNANHYTPINQNLIPTGKIEPVKNTPLDFTKPKPIGQHIQQPHPQLQHANGYDHNYILNPPKQPNKLTHAATLHEPTTGRTLQIHTDQPAIQLYTGNFLDGRLTGKNGKPYQHRSGICLETQHYPDSPNQPHFPNTILRPNQTYKTTTTFTFTTN